MSAAPEGSEPPALDLAQAAPLDVSGYDLIAGRGDVHLMGQFITRIIRSRGGRVADGSQLRSLAFRHVGGGGSATSVSGASSSSVVLSFRHLAAELESCSWIDWAPQGGGGACGSGSGPCGGCCGGASEAPASTLPPPQTVDGQGSGRLIGDDDGCKKAKLSCKGSAATPSNEEAFSSLGADPLGGFQLVDLEPSAPPPSDAEGAAAAAPSSSSSSSSAAAAGSDIEVQVNGSDFFETPVEDLGALGVYMQRTRNPLSWILSRRMYVLVLRHPNDPSRGIRLFESMSREDAVAVGRAIASHLELGDAHRVEHEIYMAVYNDPEMRAALSQLHAASEQQADGAAAASAATSAATAAASSSSSSAAPAPQEIGGDCPICFCEIEPGDAAMRCSGQGGQHHYFHSQCMQQWISQCRSGHGATCPVCRGSIQFNAQRLDAFLSGRQSAGLSSEDRTFLQQAADRLKAAGGTWGEAMNWDNAKHVGGIAAAGGWGFMIGYSQPPVNLQYHLTLDLMSREQNIAQGVGWVLGVVARVVKEQYREKRRRDEEQRR